ncbi:MAG: TetR family transcriptional regulator [Bacteroidota bacterium]
MSVKTKREKFDQVALELIHQKGFKATTMRDIAGIQNFPDLTNKFLSSVLK